MAKLTADTATELDRRGALVWVRCELCQAEPGQPCAASVVGPREAPLLLCGVPEDGHVHRRRMTIWLEFKARVCAGAERFRRPNMQQMPRRAQKGK